jgi:hypothetical protein
VGVRVSVGVGVGVRVSVGVGVGVRVSVGVGLAPPTSVSPVLELADGPSLTLANGLEVDPST